MTNAKKTAQVDNGSWIVATEEGWLPGKYDTEKTARYAARFSFDMLSETYIEHVFQYGPFLPVGLSFLKEGRYV